MAQINSAARPSTGAVPENQQCGFCKNPIQKEFYRTLNRFACAGCAAQIRGVVERNVYDAVDFLKASAAGLLVSLACALAWAGITLATHLEIGIIASLIGVAVGKVVYITAGKRRGATYQGLAAFLAVVGIVVGKLLLRGWEFAEIITKHGRDPSLSRIILIFRNVLQTQPSLVFDGYDLLWIGIAIYAAWRLCKAPPITIVGPFPVVSSATRGLQFQSVEPVSPHTPDAP